MDYQEGSRFSAFIRCWRKKCEYAKTVHQLFTVFEEAYDSLSKEVFYKHIGCEVPTATIMNADITGYNATYYICELYGAIFQQNTTSNVQLIRPIKLSLNVY
jgi:hypothetical protein